MDRLRWYKPSGEIDQDRIEMLSHSKKPAQRAGFLLLRRVGRMPYKNLTFPLVNFRSFEQN